MYESLAHQRIIVLPPLLPRRALAHCTSFHRGLLVNLFQESGSVIHFNNPKVQASITANTYVISGRAEVKELKDLLPGIINQLGPDNLANLKRIAENMKESSTPAEEEDSDDDIPELEANFEDVSNVEDELS